MPTRIRARHKQTGHVYTILGKKLPSRGQVEVRNPFGFVEKIAAKDLEAIPSNEPGSVLKFGDDA